MKNSELFTAAHKLARTFEGNYSACFILALQTIKNMETPKTKIEKLAEQDPELDIIWSALGLAYSANNEFIKAVECFEIALQFNPSDEDIMHRLNFAVDQMKKNQQPALEESPQEPQDEKADSILSKDEILILLKAQNDKFDELLKLIGFSNEIQIKSFINDQVKQFFENPSKKKIKKLKKSLEQHVEVWPEEKREELFNEYFKTIKRYEELQPPKWKKYGSTLLKLAFVIK